VKATEEWQGPIFVVGASRSGTTLLRRILCQHSHVWLAPETHYFDDLRPRLEISPGALLTPTQEKASEKYFVALSRDRYGVVGDPAKSSLDVDELRRRATEIGGGDAYFEAYCRLGADVRGKAIWGEKTPRHVFRIEEMLAAYPEAKIIALVRDPRAVIASYRNLHARALVDPARKVVVARDLERARKSYNIVLATLLWRGAVRAAAQAQDAYGSNRVYVLRYEAVALEPRRALSELAEWLGLPFEEGMLEVSANASSYAPRQGRKGITSEPVDRWRKTLSRHEVAVIEAYVGKALREFGYEREGVRLETLHAVAAALVVPAALTRAVYANRDRMGKVLQYIRKRLRFAVAR
jgi:Sulfotransferase family